MIYLKVEFEDLRVAGKLRVDRAIFDAELDAEALAINDLGLQFHNIVSIHDYTFRSDYMVAHLTGWRFSINPFLILLSTLNLTTLQLRITI